MILGRVQVPVQHAHLRMAREHVEHAIAASEAVDPIPRARNARERWMVLHDDLLFEQGRRHPGRERIQREMITFIHRGIAARRADLGDGR